MLACTFFGHRACPDSIRTALKMQIEDLIVNHGVTMFYVGSQGRFDALVHSVLRELSPVYPQCQYAVVLAYLPPEGTGPEDFAETMLPEGIETVPPRFALAWRNRWMLQRADYVIAYVTHDWGGAVQYAQKAHRMGKTVINLSISDKTSPK